MLLISSLKAGDLQIVKHEAAKTITRKLVNIQRSIENREYHLCGSHATNG
nr:MAG TPA: hypothetical protein [Caudoviricetes sp.]